MARQNNTSNNEEQNRENGFLKDLRIPFSQNVNPDRLGVVVIERNAFQYLEVADLEIGQDILLTVSERLYVKPW